MKYILKILLLCIFLTACFKENENKTIDGVLSFEQKDGKTILLEDSKLANGIIKGHDDILNLEYEIKFKNGLPTGDITFLNQGQKFIELMMAFNFTTHKATGDIKIFDIDRDGNVVVNMEYKDIDSQIDNFIDTSRMKPTLNWYVDNPINVFKKVEISSYGKKISSIKEGKYYFYDDDGQEIELSMKANTEDSKDILGEFLDQISYDDVSSKLPPVNSQIIFENTQKSIKKLKVDGLYLTGTFETTDSSGNNYQINYVSGLPNGNFEMKLKKDTDLIINASGMYNYASDMWQGDITISDSANNVVEIKNALMKGENLFEQYNEIIHDWINYDITSDEPISIDKAYRFTTATIYLNSKKVANIKEGQYIPNEK